MQTSGQNLRNVSIGAARLWRIEWRKLSRLRSFWVISGLYLLLIPLLYQFFMHSVIQVRGQEVQASTFFALSGGALWDFMLFTGSYGVYLFVLLLLSYTNQERECGLWRQYVSDGMPAADLVSGKALLVLGLSGLATGLLVLGWASIMLLSDADSPPALPTILLDTAGYGLYFTGFLSLAFTLNLLIQRTALSFLLVLLWGLVLESIVRWLDPTGLGNYLPVHQLNALVPNPVAALLEGSNTDEAGFISQLLSLTGGFIWAMTGLVISYISLEYRDLR